MFDFPNSDRPDGFKFKTNLLKSVIFQLKYEERGLVSVSSKEIAEKLKGAFPIFVPVIEGHATLKISKDKTPIIQSGGNTTKGLELKTEDNNKILSITEDTLSYTIHGSAYENFEKSISEIKKDFLPILSGLNILKFSRIAIRKINLMEQVEPKNYSDNELLIKVFNQNLINNFISFPDTNSMVSGVTNVRIEKENNRLNVSYGLIPPTKEGGKQILLDIDLFCINQEVDIDSVESKWKEINNEIFNIFNWAICEGLKESLNQ